MGRIMTFGYCSQAPRRGAYFVFINLTKYMKKIFFIMAFLLLPLLLPSKTFAYSSFCNSIDGAVILGYDSSTNEYTKIIGVINNKYDNYSISNQYGYGSKYTTNSITNTYGNYGSKYSNDSAMNPYASNPPLLVTKDGNSSAYLRVSSKNAISPYTALYCANQSYNSGIPNWASSYENN